MNKCPQCGANSHSNYVCEYCGYITSKNIKVARTNDSFDDAISIIQENLDALHDIHKPTIKSGIVAVMRVIIAIYTFGISLIFWRKPKKRFNKNSYNKLKNIVRRNIEQLKVSSQSSTNLLNRIQVVENELIYIETEIKKNLKAKRITIFLTIAAFISIFIINGKLNPTYKHQVFPLQEKLYGNINENLTIYKNNYELVYKKDDYIKKITLNLKIEGTKTNEVPELMFQDSTAINIFLQLTDKEGNVSDIFAKSELNSTETEKIRTAYSRDAYKIYRTKFIIYPKQTITEIPKEITHFKITANYSKK